MNRPDKFSILERGFFDKNSLKEDEKPKSLFLDIFLIVKHEHHFVHKPG